MNLIRHTPGLLSLWLRTPASGTREQARQGVRRAIRHALAEKFGIAHPTIVEVPDRGPELLSSPPGPQLVLSISHADGLSAGAISDGRVVGIDVMRVVGFAECVAVARDYLGPVVARRLGALPPAQRGMAFADAWTGHEARLKCRGRSLGEWQPGDAAAPAGLSAWPLCLPPGYVGWIAVAPPAGE